MSDIYLCVAKHIFYTYACTSICIVIIIIIIFIASFDRQ